MSNLFDAFADAPAARSTDPATSHAAAASVTKSGARARNAALVLKLVTANPGKTGCELAALTDEIDRTEVSRRLSDLNDKARVYKGDARACAVNGTKQTTWYATGAGPKV